MKQYTIYGLLLSLLTFIPVGAQESPDFYTNTNSRPAKKIGLIVGGNYSVPTVTAALDGANPNRMSLLGGVASQFGCYLGGFMETDLVGQQLSFRVDAILQMKGVRAQDQNGVTRRNVHYYYLGLTPQLGLALSNHLQVYLGVQANTLVSKGQFWSKNYPLEIGSLLRLQYKRGRYGVEVSYFRGFTRFETFQIGISSVGKVPLTHDFYNQNGQLGFIYTWPR